MTGSAIEIKDKSGKGDTIKIKPFKKDIRKTNPHKHNNYFEVIYLSQGKGFHFIDIQKYPVTPPVIFFVRKEQTHYFDLEGEPDGFVGIIKKAFVEKSLDKDLKFLMAKLSSQECLTISDNETIEGLFRLLAKEYANGGANSFQVIEGMLKALFSKILEVSKPIIPSFAGKSNLYQSFYELLQAGSLLKNSVQFYAAQLNTSPQNLNAACRKAVNQSAAEVLADFITSEAKRLLLYTNNTVSQIALMLDFKDASHFVKYFKRITGQTPQAFRLSAE